MKNILVQADIIITTNVLGKEFIVLIKRKHTPFRGIYSLPGGLLKQDERLADAAIRELEADTGIKHKKLGFFDFFDELRRDPRGRVISAVFMARIPYRDIQLHAGNDASSVELCQIQKLPKLGFDHARIISEFIRREL
jgi:8-oxo-dGTP diphosphatase